MMCKQSAADVQGGRHASDRQQHNCLWWRTHCVESAAQGVGNGVAPKTVANGGGVQHQAAAAEGAPKQAPGACAPLARLWRPAAQLAAAMRPLLARGLRATTLLLMGIWFVNALCYYGLVLLTTTVSVCGAHDPQNPFLVNNCFRVCLGFSF